MAWPNGVSVACHTRLGKLRAPSANPAPRPARAGPAARQGSPTDIFAKLSPDHRLRRRRVICLDRFHPPYQLLQSPILCPHHVVVENVRDDVFDSHFPRHDQAPAVAWAPCHGEHPCPPDAFRAQSPPVIFINRPNLVKPGPLCDGGHAESTARFRLRGILPSRLGGQDGTAQQNRLTQFHSFPPRWMLLDVIAAHRWLWKKVRGKSSTDFQSHSQNCPSKNNPEDVMPLWISYDM